ncbi:unnamed protein product [Brassicogethes aeneus]|uniref:Type VII secretion system protein EssD-like domain-containing protein n=1 Tax=Brassicogethes aeneus TaxID=1431903 RepID=A0A9P0B0M0_BRAAE|nr:unnamed protein product [Brassicogethes aeneus]
MFYLRILKFLTIIGFINCGKIKLGEIKTGHGSTKHISFPFTVEGRYKFPIITTTREQYCSGNTILRRTKRQNNNGTGGLNSIEEYANYIENDDNKFNTMTFSNSDFALRSVSTYEVSADANHASPIGLTASMRAEIHYTHMAVRRDPIITSNVREHLRQMDRENDDEAGHLLASSLGGPGVSYNFVPQSSMVNRAVNVAGVVIPQPGWYEVEAMLRDYLTEVNGSGHIQWTLVVLYSLLPNSRRPTDFLLSIRFYDNHHNLVNWRREGAVRGYHFRNVPGAACANANHPWWSH